MFVVEGKKMVQEAYQSGWPIEALVVREDQDLMPLQGLEGVAPERRYVAGAAAYRQLSTQAHAEGVLAVVCVPPHAFERCASLEVARLQGPGFMLDRIQDPGNLGTIIRTADWFGLRSVICSMGTVDVLNPKCLRSSMGSIFRVHMVYVEAFEELIRSAGQRVWLAGMQGLPLGEASFGKDDFVVLGNEARGLSQSLASRSGINFVTIPGTGGAESLNVAIAAGIFGWELSKVR